MSDMVKEERIGGHENSMSPPGRGVPPWGATSSFAGRSAAHCAGCARRHTATAGWPSRTSAGSPKADPMGGEPGSFDRLGKLAASQTDLPVPEAVEMIA